MRNYFKVTLADSALFFFDQGDELSTRRAYAAALTSAESVRKAFGMTEESRELVSVWQAPSVRGIWDSTRLVGEWPTSEVGDLL